MLGEGSFCSVLVVSEKLVQLDACSADPCFPSNDLIEKSNLLDRVTEEVEILDEIGTNELLELWILIFRRFYKTPKYAERT